MAPIPLLIPMGQSQSRGPGPWDIRYQVQRLAALVCEALRGRVMSRSRTFAPRIERKPVHLEVQLIGSDESLCSGEFHSKVNQMLASIRDSQPHWLGTARFHALTNYAAVLDGWSIVTNVDPATGASCRCRAFYDSVRAERVIACDWLFTPVHAPGTWTRRKRRARYRRGRESVRPRQRRTR